MFTKFKAIIEQLDGDIAEVGVYQGKSALQLATLFPQKQIHLFDTFEGHPQPNPSIDVHKKGKFSGTSLEKVKQSLARFESLRFYKGVFPLSAAGIKQKKFCFVNVDVDLYKSTKDCLIFFFPLLVPRGIIFVQDDYGYPDCPGATKAVNEFIAANNLVLERDETSAWMIKP